VPTYQVVALQKLLRKEGLERLHRLPDSNIQQYPTGFAGTELGQLLQVLNSACNAAAINANMGLTIVASTVCRGQPRSAHASTAAQLRTFSHLNVLQVDSLNIQSLSQSLYSQGLDVISAPPGLEQQARLQLTATSATPCWALSALCPGAVVEHLFLNTLFAK
jgi:hypothetical protein